MELRGKSGLSLMVQRSSRKGPYLAIVSQKLFLLLVLNVLKYLEYVPRHPGKVSYVIDSPRHRRNSYIPNNMYLLSLKLNYR